MSQRIAPIATAALVMALAATGCWHHQSGGYTIVVAPESAVDDAPAPEAWACEYLQYRSTPLGPEVYVDQREMGRRFDVERYDAFVSTDDEGTAYLPAFYQFEGIEEGLLHGQGVERKAEIRFYAIGYEMAYPTYNLFYDKARLRLEHQRMTQALEGEARPDVRRLIREQYVRQWGPAVLDPDAPGAVPVLFEPWDNSTVGFADFWHRIATPDAFDNAMKLWKRWAWRWEHGPAVREIVRWHVARYEAAVEQDPELARHPVAAKNIARLREMID